MDNEKNKAIPLDQHDPYDFLGQGANKTRQAKEEGADMCSCKEDTVKLPKIRRVDDWDCL